MFTGNHGSLKGNPPRVIDLHKFWRCLNGSLENPESGIPPEFRRNFSRSVFLIQNDSDDFSEECTSSEYTPKINRRLSEGFRRYPNSPTNKVDSEDISEEYTSSEYTPKINRKLSECFRSYSKSPKFFKAFFLIQNDSEDFPKSVRALNILRSYPKIRPEEQSHEDGRTLMKN